MDEFAELVPETILPSQFNDLRRSDTSRDPIRRLMLAVLEDGIGCFQNGESTHNARRMRLAHEAEEWIFSGADDGPFAFVNICNVLEIDPLCLRDGLSHWRARGGAIVRHNKNGYGRRAAIRASSERRRSGSREF